MTARALSQLPVAKGKESEALNREIYPMIRELVAELRSMEGDLADLEAKLDAIILLLAPPANATNQVASTTSSAVFASQACLIGFWCKNISTGSQKSTITKGQTATTGNGYELSIGDERFYPCRNMNEYAHISSAISANLCFEAV